MFYKNLARGHGGLRQRRAKNRALQSVFDTEPTVNSLQSWVVRACMTFDVVSDIVADIVADIKETTIS